MISSSVGPRSFAFRISSFGFLSDFGLRPSAFATGLLAHLLSAAAVLAWSEPGLNVIAARAYQELSPDLKSKAAQILQAHPEYETWKKSFAPGTPKLDLGLYLFMRASAWPGTLQDEPGKSLDHPHWHSMDYPLKPPGFPMLPCPAPADDILHGIAECERVVADTNASPPLRAVSLSWLGYLIGELHQPLNCGSLFNATFPAGDNGGRGFFVKPATRATRLHRYWDVLLGRASHAPEDMAYALEIGLTYPRDQLPELASATTPKQWSLETREVAIKTVYLNGDLPGGTRPETAPPLPTGYAKSAKSAAERQAARAAHRLADELRKLLR